MRDGQADCVWEGMASAMPIMPEAVLFWLAGWLLR